MGTFEFYVLLESIRREKAEKAAFARLLVSLAVEEGGVTKKRGALILIKYEEELHQFKYNYKYVPIERRLEMEQTSARNEDEERLAKVSALTVGDDE